MDIGQPDNICQRETGFSETMRDEIAVDGHEGSIARAGYGLDKGVGETRGRRVNIAQRGPTLRLPKFHHLCRNPAASIPLIGHRSNQRRPHLTNQTFHTEIDALNDVTKVLIDSKKGYEKCCELADDGYALRAQFLKRANERADLVSRFHHHVRSLGGEP